MRGRTHATSARAAQETRVGCAVNRWAPRTLASVRHRLVLIVAPCLAGIGGLLSVNYRLAGVLAGLTLLIEVIGNLFLQKRRDEVFAHIVRKNESRIDTIRAIGIYETLRSRQLTSDDIAKLLRPEMLDNGDANDTREPRKPHT